MSKEEQTEQTGNVRKINIFDIIAWFDKNEPWVSDSPEVSKNASNVIDEISRLKEDSHIFESYDEFAQLIQASAYLKFDMFATMFSEMGIKQHKFGGDVVMICTEGLGDQDGNQKIKPEMNVMIQRIALIIHTELIHKIFGDENRVRVLSAIDDLKKEGKLA